MVVKHSTHIDVEKFYSVILSCCCSDEGSFQASVVIYQGTIQ